MRILLLLVFLCASFFVIAQSTHQPATVVLKDGSKREGTIDNPVWEQSPVKINFHSGGTTTMYTPADLQSFAIKDGATYQSLVVKRDLRHIEPLRVPATPRDSFITEPVFAEVLLKGSQYSLFAFTDFRQHYFMQKGTDTPEELLYVAIVKRGTGMNEDYYRGNIDYLHTYRDQIGRFYNNPGDEKIKKEIAKTEYRANSLVKLFALLNGETYKKPSGKFTARLFGGAGFTQTGFHFYTNATGLEKEYNQSSSGPSFHAGALFRNKSKKPAFALRLDLNYWTASSSATHTRETLQVTYEDNYIFKQSNIMLNAAVLRELVKNESFSIHAGVSGAYRLIRYSTSLEKIENMTTHNVYENELDFNEGSFMLIPEAGAQFGPLHAALFMSVYQASEFRRGMKTSIKGMRLSYVF